MDQDAFRNMLSGPRSDAGPSRHQKGNFGAAGPKRGWGIKQTKEHKAPLPFEAKQSEEKKEAHIAPRHVQKKQPADIKYKDRAEMRRAGKDDEYKDVEDMLADFEKRKAEAEDAESVEKTRQFLGGDAAHSVMVKGLDYALLAQRKAELQREQEVERDEELDAMMDDLGSKAGPSSSKEKEDKKSKQPEEKLGKGFKSIGSRKDEAASSGEKKKKKKKKVVKQEEAGPVVPKAAPEVKRQGDDQPRDQTEPSPKPPTRIPVAAPAPLADEPEEDIFGDAGEYELGGGAVSDDGSESDEEDVKPVRRDVRASVAGRGRSRSREGDRRRYDSSSRSRSVSRRRYDSRSPDRRVDSRQRSPPRGNYRDRSRSRDRPRYRSRSRTPPRHRYRSDSRSPVRRYRSPSPRRRQYSPARSPPRRYRSRSRSRSPYGDKRRRYGSPSRSPPRRARRSPSPYSRHAPNRSRTRSPLPSHVAEGKSGQRRAKSRSPSPFMFAGPPLSRSPSASRSPSPVAHGGRLQPLQSSAITDLSGFLAAESATAKADEKKIKKAQWRARQGLGIQDGVDPSVLKREMNDKQKSNREYVMLMNKLKKDEASGGGGGGEGSKTKEDD